MDNSMREKAIRTSIDGFKVVERIYRHTYQTLIALKEEIKAEFNFKAESPLYNQSIATNDPKSWVYHFKGQYLSEKKISIEDYKKKWIPILFLQSSMFHTTDQEPLIRYGVIEKITNILGYKGIRFDDLFREIISTIHNERKPGKIKPRHCEAMALFEEKPLLDIREDSDVVGLAKEIGKEYGKHFIK